MKKIKDIIRFCLLAVAVIILSLVGNEKKNKDNLITLNDVARTAYADHGGGAGSQGWDSACGNGDSGGPGSSDGSSCGEGEGSTN